MANLLLHTCCGPCSTATVEHWQKEGLEPAGFWFNPNIHPFQEHGRRHEALATFFQGVRLPLMQAPGYDLVDFLRRVVGREGNRCVQCFRLRLGRTAREA